MSDQSKENVIRVRYAGMRKAPGGELEILYIPDQRQVLLPGQRYRIILEGLTYEKSNPRKKEDGKEKERPDS